MARGLQGPWAMTIVGIEAKPTLTAEAHKTRRPPRKPNLGTVRSELRQGRAAENSTDGES